MRLVRCLPLPNINWRGVQRDGPADDRRPTVAGEKGRQMATRSIGRRRTGTRERDRLAVLLEQRLPEIATAADAQRDLAAARGQIVDLCREVDRLRTELESAHRQKSQLQRLLQRTQAVARSYARRLDAAERRRRRRGWWPRAAVSLIGWRGSTEVVPESRPGAPA